MAAAFLYVGRAIYNSYLTSEIPGIIRPMDVSGASDDATKRGLILAQLLSGRLGEISKQMRAAEVSWKEAQSVAPNRVAVPGREGAVTPIELSSNVFRPLDLTMNVANVEVGKLISWLHSWLSEDRALSLSVVYIGDKAIITGELKNSDHDTLWIESTGKNDIEMISDVAYAIAKKPYSRNYPEVADLDPHVFGELLGSLNRIASLSRKAPVVGVAPPEYQAEYDKLEPLMRQHLPKWRTLVELVASLAERSEKLDEAIQLYRQELALLDAEKEESSIKEIEKRIAMVTARIAAAKPPVTSVAEQTDAASKVRTFMNVPLPMAPDHKRPRIGILGPPPAPDVLPKEVPVTVINDAVVAEQESDHFLVDHMGHVAQSVRMVCPDVEFVFSQLKSENGSMSVSAILQAANAMFQTGQRIDILLYPYKPPTIDAMAPILTNGVALDKTLVVFAAGNEGSKKDDAVQVFPKNSPFYPGGKWRKYVAVAAAVDLKGNPAKFTQQDPEVVWAPGTDVSNWAGTSLAAALTAGAAAYLRAFQPTLPPDRIVEILQKTSTTKPGSQVKVIDVAAALANANAPTAPLGDSPRSASGDPKPEKTDRP